MDINEIRNSLAEIISDECRCFFNLPDEKIDLMAESAAKSIIDKHIIDVSVERRIDSRILPYCCNTDKIMEIEAENAKIQLVQVIADKYTTVTTEQVAPSNDTLQGYIHIRATDYLFVDNKKGS